MKKNKSYSDFTRTIKGFHWLEITTILIPILGLFWTLHQDDVAMINRIDNTISQFHEFNKVHVERTDRLYEMFIEVVKKN
jgi:hypothetical protein